MLGESTESTEIRGHQAMEQTNAATFSSPSISNETLSQQIQEKLQELEVDSVEELREEIQEKRADMEKFATKPRKHAEAEKRFDELQSGLRTIEELQEQIESYQQALETTVVASTTTPTVNAEALTQQAQDQLRDLEVDSIEELREEIQEKQADMQRFADKPKKRAEAEKRFNELQTGLEIIVAAQKSIGSHETDVDTDMGEALSPVVDRQTHSNAQAQDEITLPAEVVAESPDTVSLVRENMQPDHVSIVPEQKFYQTDEVQPLDIVFPKIAENSNQVIRFALKALAETIPLPPSAENKLFILLQWLTLKIRKVDEVHFSGKDKVAINDAWLQSECRELYQLLGREGGNKRHLLHEFERLETDVNQKKWTQVRKKLEHLFKSQIRTLDIAQLMRMCRRVPEENVLADRDLIVLLGKSGAGKSTTIHYFLGNEFEKTEAGRLNPKKLGNFLDEVRVGEGKVSETRQMGLVSLVNEQTESGHFFLCDTPGFGDTGKADGVGILNSLVISRALQQCRSIRVLVLCSVSQYGAQAQGLIETLQNLTQMFRDVDACKSAFLYAFTGSSSEVEAERVLEDVSEIPMMQQQRHLSDDVIKLFEGMEKQFTEESVPFIRPLLPEESISGQILLEKLKALPAIESPKTMVVPYLEDDDDIAMKNQLRFNKDTVIACLLRLQRPDEQTAEFNDADMQILQTKLFEIRFLAELVPSCGADAVLSACLEILVETRNSFNAALHDFLPNAIGKSGDRALSSQVLQRHWHQMQMLSRIEGVLVKMDVGTERFDGESYTVAHITLAMESIIDAVQRYYDRQCLEIDIHRLQPLAEIRQGSQQVGSNSNEATPSADLNQTLSAKGEQMAIQLGFDTFANALLHLDTQIKKLESIEEHRLSIDVIPTLVTNLSQLDALFFSSQQSSEASKHEQLLNRTEDFLVSMSNLFKQALEQRSMATAMRIIETIRQMDPVQALGANILKGTSDSFANGFAHMCTEMLTYFEKETALALTQLEPMLSIKDRSLLITQDSSGAVVSLLAQLYACEQDERFHLYFEQVTVNVQGMAIKVIDLHAHVTKVVVGIFKRNEQHLQNILRVESLPERIARVNELGSLAYSLRFFEQMAFVREKLAEGCQEHRDKAQDFMRGITIDLEKILAQTVTLGGDSYDLISNFIGQLQIDAEEDSLQPWVSGLHLTHDIYQRLQQALEQRVERLLEQGEQLSPADIKKPEDLEAAMVIKRELVLIVDLSDGMVEQTLKQKSVAFVDETDKEIQKALKKIQFMFDANPGNTLVDVTSLSKKLTMLLENTPAEVDELLDTAKQAFADSQQQGSGETRGQERERCVNVTHDYVKTMHQGSLHASRVAQAYHYLSACEKLEIHPAVVRDAKNMVNVFVHTHADFVDQACNRYMELIEHYQQETTSQDDLVVAVQGLRIHLGEYQSLKSDHPEIYDQVSQQAMQHYSQAEQQHDLVGFWENRLLDFRRKFSEQLQQAVIDDARQTDEVASHDGLAKQVAFCQQFKVFDKISIVDKNTDEGSFSVLYKRYNDILINQRLPQLKEMFAAFAQQDYSTAATQLVELKATQQSQSLYAIAIDYLQAEINDNVEQLKRDKLKIKNTNDIKPTALANCVELWQKMDELQPILSHMPQSIKDKRKNMLNDLPRVVTAWSENHIDLTKKAVNDLNLGEAAQRILTLREFVAYIGRFCPTGARDKLEGLVQQLDSKLAELHQQYDTDVLEWGKLSCTTSNLFESLTASKDVQWKDRTFGQHWEQISEVILGRAKQKMKALQDKHAIGGLDMSQMGEATDKITKFWSSLPAHESEWTKLRITLGQAVRDFNMAIQNSMQREDQERAGRLRMISEYIKYFDSLYGYQRLWEGYRKVHDAKGQVVSEINTLEKKLLSEIRKGSFSRENLYALLEYNQYLGNQIHTVKISFNVIVEQLKILFTEVYRKLQQSYALERGRTQLHSIKEIEKNLSKLNEFRELCVYFKGEDEKQLNTLLPRDFNEKMRLAFQPAIEKLLTNANDFVEGFRRFDIPAIVKALDVAKRWDSVLEQVCFCIGTYSPDKQTETMKQVLGVAPYRQMLARVSEKVAEAKRGLLELDVGALLKSQSDTQEQRQEFYRQIAHDVDGLGDIEKLADHLGVMGDAESIRCAHQEGIAHIQRLFEAVYSEAANELKNIKAGNPADWRKFDALYKNLIAFCEACGTHKHLGKLELAIPGASKAMNVKNADDQLYQDFLAFLDDQAVQWRRIMRNKEESKSKDNLETIAEQLIKFEQMATDLPTFRKTILEEIDKLLSDCRRERGIGYLQRVAAKLKADESGKGRMVIENHGCFSGTAIAMRNQATSSQTITEVLDSLEENLTKDDAPKAIGQRDKETLKKQYDIFKVAYDRLLDQYLLPELDFDKNKEKLLAELKQSLEVLVEKLPKVTTSTVVWSSEIKTQIPEIIAHVFAIWTLRDSKAYFDAGDVPNRKECLKIPHPAQVIAIFRMTGVGLPDDQFDNHLVEILTGEGKSVCMAVAATVFALAGFEVKCACYSEYLSLRDYHDFDKIFHFLGITTHIRYGTFNQIYEEIINEQGDLRQKVEQLVLEQHPKKDTQLLTQEQTSSSEARGGVAIAPKSRPRIMIVDEVDVFFKKDFYGKLYRPFFLLQDKVVIDLMNWIWQQHDGGQALSVHSIKASAPYRACCERYQNFDFLVDSGIEHLLKDINSYRQGFDHEYLVEKGQIMYRYQDGTSAKKTEGYKTVWAYYHEHYKNRTVTQEQLTKHTGIIVYCGAFSYAEMLRGMGTFAHIIGVTGTLKTLSPAEKSIIRDEFGIRRYSYMPSAYGPNNLVFAKNKGVKVEEDKDYHHALLEEIKEALIGPIHKDSHRAVMVFFSDMSALDAFSKSLPADMKSALSIMSEASSASVEERDAEIKRATSAGQITLLTRALGRGTDFVCYDQSVIANGGVHVIQTFLSKEVAEERQIQGRTARQGQKGSYSLVLRARDLKEVYGVDAERVKKMRADGAFYDELHKMRCEHFKTEYQGLTDQIKSFQETCHTPSVQLLQWVVHARPGGVREAKKLLMLFNETSSAKITHSKTVILMDATGSMGGLINGVKATINKLFSGLKGVLQNNSLDPNCFETQLCAYRNYEDGPNMMLQTSPWSSEPARLQTFMEGISASGGARTMSGNEAVEIGLWHVNQEAENGQGRGVTQVILIADMPPNTQQEINERRRITEGTYNWNKTRFSQPTFYKGEVDKLASRTPSIPVHSFYVSSNAQEKFAEIAKATGGETGSLEINSEKGSQLLVGLFAKKVVTDVAREDESLRAKLLRDCSVTFGA